MNITNLIIQLQAKVNDLTYKDFKQMSSDEHVMIGKNNQKAIEKVMDIQNYQIKI